MARVAVTGAAGTVGRAALDALADHDVTPITHRAHDDLDGPVLEIDDRAAVREALAGHDAVVHLAAEPSPEADWDALREPNLDGVHAVYEAAVAGGLDRVVFASTNHVVNMYNVADPAEYQSLVADPRSIHPDDPVRPDSLYGVSKVAGEAMGSYYADRHGLAVVNLRIGWLLTAERLRETQSTDAAAHARAMWLSPRDCRDGLRGAVTADLPENPATVNLVSRNAERYLSLTETMRAIDYRPRDDASEVV